ncbi:MAG: M48 family metalloprotease [Chloroflexota bacterium]|nr:M48 family metalloprotease [Chloroflexota bacterium]
MKTTATQPTDHGRLFGLGLFGLTLGIELLGVWPRYLLMRLLFWPISLVTQGLILFRNQRLLPEVQLVRPLQSDLGVWVLGQFNSVAVPLAHLVAWGPLVLAVMTLLFLPGGFLLTRLATGARPPSRRELALVREVLAAIAAKHPQVRAPNAFYVIDNLEPTAYMIGTTLYLHSGLLSETTASAHLLGVIAHQLGHRNSLDGRLTLALRRLVLPPVYWISRTLGTIAPGTIVTTISRGSSGCVFGGVMLVGAVLLALAGGGLGVLLLTPVWATYWRQREFAADQFARQLECDGPLIEYLRRYTLHDVASPYFLSSAPANELRIDRLLHAPDEPATMSVPKRDAAVLGGALVAVALGGLLFFGGPGVFGLGPSPEGEWHLRRFAYGSESPVWQDADQLGVEVYVYMQADTPGDQVVVQMVEPRLLTGGELRGSFDYLDHDTIVITVSGSTYGLPLSFNGQFDVLRDGEELVLRGVHQQYAFAPLGR